MPLTIGVNSYVGLADADDYFANKLRPGDWPALIDPADDPELERKHKCERALIEATAAVDRLGFAGSITRRAQPLAWPRIRMQDREGRVVPASEVPDAVKAATCEFARHLLTAPAAQPSLAISQKRVGDLSITYRATTPDPVPPIVRQLLGPFLSGSPNSIELIP